MRYHRYLGSTLMDEDSIRRINRERWNSIHECGSDAWQACTLRILSMIILSAKRDI